MKACVLIEVDDQGQVSVGTYPGELPAEMKQGMQPAGSVDEALAQAKQMLEAGEGETGAQPAEPQEGEAQTTGQEQASFRQGFQRHQPMGGGY